MKIRALLLSAFIVLTAVQIFGQPSSVPVLDRVGINDLGTRPFGVYDGTNESVNLQNNNLTLSIPLLSLPGRNGHNYDLRLIYDSNIYRLQNTAWIWNGHYYHWEGSWAFAMQSPYVAVGWHLNWPVLQNDGPTVLYPPGGYGNQYTACVANSTVTLADGSRHVFRANLGCTAPTSDIASQIPVMDSEDPDGAQINVQDYAPSTVVTLRDGTKIYFTGIGSLGGTLADKVASGNIVSLGMDTVGRTITVGANSISYVDVNGNSQTITLNTSSHNVTLPTGGQPVTIANQGLTYPETLLDSVTINPTMPEHQTYSFLYRSDGELSEIEYPHQGCTSYDYLPYTRMYSDTVPAANEGPLSLPILGVSAKHVSPTGQCSTPSAYYTTTYTPTLGQVNNLEMSVLFPDNTTENHYFTDASVNPLEAYHGISAQEYEVDTLNSAGNMMKKVVTAWTTPSTTVLYSWDLPISVTTTFYDGKGNPAVSTTQKAIVYDQLSVKYDPFPYTGDGGLPSQGVVTTVSRYLNAPISTKVYDYGTGTNVGTLLTQTATTYDYDGNSALLNSNARVFGFPTKTVLTSAASSPAFTTKYFYDQTAPTPATASQHQTIAGGIPRGNLTEVDRCVDNACATILKTLYTHDDFGNITKITDPKNNSTSYFWTDSWDTTGGGNMTSCIPSAGSFAYVTKITNALNQYTTAQYRPCSGARSQLFDLNRQQTSYTFDSLGRVLSESLPDTGHTSVTYDDTNRIVTFSRLLDSQGDHVVSSATYDDIGRVIQTSLTDPQGNSTVEYTYDGRDRKISQTNPHRSQSAPTDGTTQYVLDGLGRTTQVIQPDGSSNFTDYTAFPYVTVKDEAGNQRKSKSDGAGRLVQVLEDPAGLNYETDYVYDAAGDLFCVQQLGTASAGISCPTTPSASNPFTPMSANGYHGRWFVYDDVSRLTDAYNPETGHTNWTYDNNGNVVTKTDARGITINYSPTAFPIDALNRVHQKTYTDSTPTITYYYDGVTPTGSTLTPANPLGHRTGMLDGSGWTAWSFDSMGRTLAEQRNITGVSAPKTLSYLYNPLGSPTSITYPNGTVISYGYDGAGRVATVTDTTNGLNYILGTTASSSCPVTSATGVSYTPAGAPSLYMVGYYSTKPAYGLTVNECYNSRLQPTLMAATSLDPANGTVMSYQYGWGEGVSDNGNLLALVNNVRVSKTPPDVDRSKNFYYDALNRIVEYKTPNAVLWDVKYTIDAWGNLTNKTAQTQNGYGGENLQATANNANQISGVTYDNGASPSTVGNVTYDGQFNYTYDAENRITSVAGGPTYKYDGDGERVQKSSGETYWGGGAGDALLETDNTGTPTSEYIYFLGKRIARRFLPNQLIRYYLDDQIGSSTVLTDIGGGVDDVYDYAPYGELSGNHVVLNKDTSYPNHYYFTGKERDTESGNDYFDARYYASSMGRFMSPDPMGGHYENPQTLNKYAYVINNPLTLTDPTGLDIWLQGCGKDSSTCKGNYVGTTDKDGNFTRTHLTGDQTKDATLGAHGITVTQDGKSYNGVWDTNKGENGAVTVAGAGALSGYNATVNGNCGGTCVASGEIRSADPKAGNITQALFGVLDKSSSGYVKNAGTDAMNFFHPGATNFRGHSDGDPQGIPSTHIPIDPKASLPNNEWHIDKSFPYDGVGDWLEHAGCATHTICNPQK